MQQTSPRLTKVLSSLFVLTVWAVLVVAAYWVINPDIGALRNFTPQVAVLVLGYLVLVYCVFAILAIAIAIVQVIAARLMHVSLHKVTLYLHSEKRNAKPLLWFTVLGTKIHVQGILPLFVRLDSESSVQTERESGLSLATPIWKAFLLFAISIVFPFVVVVLVFVVKIVFNTQLIGIPVELIAGVASAFLDAAVTLGLINLIPVFNSQCTEFLVFVFEKRGFNGNIRNKIQWTVSPLLLVAGITLRILEG